MPLDANSRNCLRHGRHAIGSPIEARIARVARIAAITHITGHRLVDHEFLYLNDLYIIHCFQPCCKFKQRSAESRTKRMQHQRREQVDDNKREHAIAHKYRGKSHNRLAKQLFCPSANLTLCRQVQWTAWLAGCTGSPFVEDRKITRKPGPRPCDHSGASRKELSVWAGTLPPRNNCCIEAGSRKPQCSIHKSHKLSILNAGSLPRDDSQKVCLPCAARLRL